jgi:hypothetical protein
LQQIKKEPFYFSEVLTSCQFLFNFKENCVNNKVRVSYKSLEKYWGVTCAF